MNKLVVTVDLDWACEPAIEETLDFFNAHNISPTVFITHRSPRVEAAMNKLEVGLHPYFALDSSHGSTVAEVINHVINLPHNLRGFRCHRFTTCNSSLQAMTEAGMLISSNVCTDLEIVAPFKNRFGLLEIPIFLEDGGYLWSKHPLELSPLLVKSISSQGTKVISIHPMHFCINTPTFDYMYKIKQSMANRKEWKNMTKHTLNKLRWNGRGIRDLLVELLQIAPQISPLSSLYHNALESHNHFVL